VHENRTVPLAKKSLKMGIFGVKFDASRNQESDEVKQSAPSEDSHSQTWASREARRKRKTDMQRRSGGQKTALHLNQKKAQKKKMIEEQAGWNTLLAVRGESPGNPEGGGSVSNGGQNTVKISSGRGRNENQLDGMETDFTNTISLSNEKNAGRKGSF